MVARLCSPARRPPLFPSSSSVLPRVSPRPKRGGLLSPSEEEEGTREVGGRARNARTRSFRVGNGGLCGHCSRDLPLDRRLLFIAELTGRNGAVSG